MDSAVNASAGALGAEAPAGALVGLRDLSRLKWRCRRGLLENDLLIERFFARHERTLTRVQAQSLQVLMDLADNDLLDLLLRRNEPSGELAQPGVLEVLSLLRPQSPAGSVSVLDPALPSFIDSMPIPALRNSHDTV